MVHDAPRRDRESPTGRGFVEDVLANGLNDSTNSMADDPSNLRVTPGLRAAWGRSETLGWLLHGDLGMQDMQELHDESVDTEVFLEADGALSLDMSEQWRPDLGFILNAMYHSRGSRNEDLGGGGWVTGLGILFTGRPELSAGLQVVDTRLHQTTMDNEFSAVGFNLVLRHDLR